MVYSRSIASALFAAIAAGMLAACAANATAGGATPVSVPPMQGANAGRVLTPRLQTRGVSLRRVAPFMERVAAPAHLAYVADFNANFIGVFSQAGKLVGTLTTALNSPQGMTVDRMHDLWVANTGDANVLEFARGATSPEATLDDAGQYPVDVAVCPDDAVFVSNIYPRGSSGGGSINVYPTGSTEPATTLTWPQEGSGLFLTCDRAGNVYQGMTLSTAPSGPGIVVVYPHGKQAGAKRLGAVAPSFPGGIVMDAAGNLLIDDQNAETVTEYTTAGAPTGNAVATGGGFIVGIAAIHSGKMVGGANASTSEGEAFSFPQGAYVESYYDQDFSVNGPLGFAYDPGSM